MKFYAITLKWLLLTDTPTQEDYETWMHRASSLYPSISILNSCYELDTANRLHYHALIEGPDRIGYKRLQVKNMHQHIEHLVDDVNVIRWDKYIDEEKKQMYLFV